MYLTGVVAPLPGDEYCATTETGKAVDYLSMSSTDYFLHATDLTGDNGATGSVSPTLTRDIKIP